MVQCPQCGEDYNQLSQHWNGNSCEWESFTKKQDEIIQGLLLGDGTLCDKDGCKPYLSVSMTTKEFIEWFDDVFGYFSTGVSVREGRTESRSDVYVARTRTHPELKQYRIYKDDYLSFIKSIELTPLVAMCWYVSDGTVMTKESSRPTARFTSRKDDEMKKEMKKLFVDKGFDPVWSHSQLVFDADGTEDLFNWLGEPLPGFEYKFPDPPDLDNTFSKPTKTQWDNKDLFYEKRYEEGYSYKQLAELWDCSTSTVHTWDRKHGFVN